MIPARKARGSAGGSRGTPGGCGRPSTPCASRAQAPARRPRGGNGDRLRTTRVVGPARRPRAHRRVRRATPYAMMDAASLRRLSFSGRIGGFWRRPHQRLRDLGRSDPLRCSPPRRPRPRGWVFPQGRERPVTERPLASAAAARRWRVRGEGGHRAPRDPATSSAGPSGPAAVDVGEAIAPSATWKRSARAPGARAVTEVPSTRVDGRSRRGATSRATGGDPRPESALALRRSALAWMMTCPRAAETRRHAVGLIPSRPRGRRREEGGFAIRATSR